MIRLTVIVGHDNDQQVTITSNGSAINFVTNGVTRIDLECAGLTLASGTGEIVYTDGGLITLKLGMWALANAMSGSVSAKLIAYDASNLNGIDLTATYPLVISFKE